MKNATLDAQSAACYTHTREACVSSRSDDLMFLEIVVNNSALEHLGAVTDSATAEIPEVYRFLDHSMDPDRPPSAYSDNSSHRLPTAAPKRLPFVAV